MQHDIVSWLHAIDEYALMYNWSDRATCHLALSKLRGPAETWYHGLPTRNFKWSEWKEMLMEHFKPKRNLTQAMINMLACKPKSHNDMYEYVFEKLTYIHKMRIPLTDADKVDLIMGGIDDPQIKFAVEVAEIKDPAILARHFRTIQSSSGGPTTSSMFTQRNSSRPIPKCYYCKNRGHMQKDCHALQRNNNSGQRQYNNQLVSYPADVRFVKADAEKANKKFYKDALINLQLVKCYIDFGSECSLISTNAVELLNLNPIPLGKNSLTLKTIRGDEGSLLCHSYVTARVSVDGVEKQITLYVLDQLALDVEVLIGQNFTELDDIEYIRTGQNLLFKTVTKLLHSKLNP